MIRKFRWIFLIIASIASILSVHYIFITSKSELFTPDFTKGLNSLLNALTAALFCLVLVLGAASGRARFRFASGKALVLLIWVLVAAVAGVACSRYISPGKYADLAVLLVDVAAAAMFAFVYFRRRRKYAESVASNSIRKSAEGAGEVRYSFAVLYGSLFVQTVALVVYFILTFRSANDLFVMAPLFGILLCLVLWYVVKWRGFLLLAYVWTVVSAGTYMYGTFMTYHYSAFGEILAFTLLYLSSLIPLGDLYCRREEAI